MSGSYHHLALSRQWEMLMRLPSGPPGITTTEMTTFLEGRGFGVSRRTVERDLDRLSGLFYIACNTISKPFGWYWRNRQEFPSVEVFDAICLLLAEDHLRSVLPESMRLTLEDRLSMARRKLSQIPSHRYINEMKESLSLKGNTFEATTDCADERR
jgi:predicted DNA-binding transcriptional regulator YafY